MSLRGASPAGGVSQGGVLEHRKQPTLHSGEPVKASLAGALPLQYRPSDHEVTPAVMRAGNAARSLRGCSTNDSAHLVEIATDSMLLELRRSGLYIKPFFPDVAQQTHETESVVDYPCAMSNVQT